MIRFRLELESRFIHKYERKFLVLRKNSWQPNHLRRLQLNLIKITVLLPLRILKQIILIFHFLENPWRHKWRRKKNHNILQFRDGRWNIEDKLERNCCTNIWIWNRCCDCSQMIKNQSKQGVVSIRFTSENESSFLEPEKFCKFFPIVRKIVDYWRKLRTITVAH